MGDDRGVDRLAGYVWVTGQQAGGQRAARRPVPLVTAPFPSRRIGPVAIDRFLQEQGDAVGPRAGAVFEFLFQIGPGGEAVIAGQGLLYFAQPRRCRVAGIKSVEAGKSLRIAFSGGFQPSFGITAQGVESRAYGKSGHGPSFRITPDVRFPRPEEG